MTKQRTTDASKNPYSDALGLTTPTTAAPYLRAARLRLGLTVLAASEKIGVARETVIDWERGALPRVATVPAIAAAYGVELHELAAVLDTSAQERG